MLDNRMAKIFKINHSYIIVVGTNFDFHLYNSIQSNILRTTFMYSITISTFSTLFCTIFLKLVVHFTYIVSVRQNLSYIVPYIEINPLGKCVFNVNLERKYPFIERKNLVLFATPFSIPVYSFFRRMSWHLVYIGQLK